MTNEELVALIQAGDREKLPELWEQVRRFVWKRARRWAIALDGLGGVTSEDLVQAGFLAVLEAVERHDPTKGAAFNTMLGFTLKSAFTQAAGLRTQRDKNEPLRFAVSLDVPVGGEDDDILLVDVIVDPDAHRRFEEVEAKEMQEAVKTALQTLTEDQRTAIRLRYWYGLTNAQAASVMGITEKEAGKLEQKALRTLRHPTISKELWKYV